MLGELVLLFSEGLLAFVSPCMLPMLPVYMMYLAAETENGKKASVVNTIGFVCGFTAVFMALGATATTLGALMNEHRMLLQRAGGAVILVFGLNFLGVFRLGFLDVEKKLDFRPGKRGGILGALLFGAAFSLGWSPCLGPFLGAALILAGNGRTALQGVFYLFVFSMGLGLPYILAAVFFTKIRGVFLFMKKHGRAVKLVSGAVLSAAGALLMFDLFYYWTEIFY